MQELRFVAVSEDGSYAVLAVPGRSGRYILPIDERLRAVAMGQTSRLAQYEIEVESPLRPKEIQARIRAGETAEEIADAAGIPVERVRWFEGPVLAERAYIADQAQAASVRRAGDSGGPGPRLGDIVPERLIASGATPEDGQWDSRKRGDGNWQVTLTFPSGGRLHVAEWVFDSRRRHVMPDDDNAARLSLPESELPPEPISVPGEATVTPLAPRLGAAAGMGGGGMSGGFGGGSGVGVRSFRPERSVIPDRSLGGDRSLADRPLSPPSAPMHAQASSSSADRPVMPERPAISHSPAAPPAPPRPAQPTPHRDRDPGPEPTVYRAPAAEHRAPEQRAPEQPAPAGTVPVSAPAYVFEDLPSPTGERVGHAPARHIVFEDPEPAFRDEQLELAPAPTPAPAPAPASASTAPSASAPLPRPPARPEEHLRPPEAAAARELAANAPAAPQTQQPGPAAEAQPVTQAQPVAQAQPVSKAAAVTPSEPTPVPQPAPVSTPAPSVQVRTAETSPAAQAEVIPPATHAPAPAEQDPTTAAGPATGAPTEPVAASAAPPPAIESPAASAPTAPAQPAPAPPEPASSASPEPTPESVPAAAPPAQAEPAEEQSARPRPGSKRSAKGRRSSVPSWDEIMLGSSRQRD